MKKRYVGYAVWMALSCLLYFFENNTGTRMVLTCSLLLPVAPAVRRCLFGRDETKTQPRTIPQTVDAFLAREEDEPGEVRAYLPGDPINRIHWKLSAKRDELLVRERARDRTAEEAERETTFPNEASTRARPARWAYLIGFLPIALALTLLFAIPSANQGMRALLNRLFDASEAVNAYVYDRFSVSADQSVGLTAALLATIPASLLAMTLFSGSRLAALCLAAGCVVFQIHFGLAFPAWANVILFALLIVWTLRRPWTGKTVLSVLAGVAALSVAVLLIWPGVDAATEAASESVRDRLSQMAQSFAGTAQELPAGENETRHAHTQSLTEGDREALTDREYRLVTVEEEPISMPHWINYLRIVLLLLLTVALVILPFFPFVLLNRRRKRALDARAVFQSGNVSEAVFAIFQQVIAWLETTGNGAGNLPYAQWDAAVFGKMSPDYAERFAQCEKLFEEAAYSDHEMREEQRQQVLALLNETEQALRMRADWKQRLRLRYKECLWV